MSAPRCFLGIDPGLSGGIAWIDSEGAGAVVMPVLNDEPDLNVLSGLYLDKRPTLVMIERAQAARTAGNTVGVGGFKIGVNYGLILGQIRERGLPLEVVGASTWKRSLRLADSKLTPKERKDKAVALARDLFPSVDLIAPGCRKYHDGMAEALLLAEYARRTHGGRL